MRQREGSGTLHRNIPSSPSDLDLSISVSAEITKADTQSRKGTLKIPPMSAASFENLCSMPDTLRYDPKLGRIVPDTFDVSVRFINTGNAPADDLETKIFLPRDIVLVDTADSKTRPITPSLLQPGDTSGSVTWKVRILPNYRSVFSAQFIWTISGKHLSGEPLFGNTMFCSPAVLEGYPPVLSVVLHAQDTVRITSTYDKPEKFPVPISAVIANVSNTTQRLSMLSLVFPSNYCVIENKYGNSITLADSTPAMRKMDTVLAPGDTVRVDWMCLVDHFTSLSAIPFKVVVFDSAMNEAVASRSIIVNRPPGFDFKLRRIINNWPYIEIWSTFSCSELFAVTDRTDLFTVTEDDRIIPDITIWCPDVAMIRCPISSTLVLSAESDNIFPLRHSAYNYIEEHDNFADETAIFWGDIPYTPITPITANKQRLQSDVLSVPPSEHPYLYDAIYYGLLNLIENGNNNCRAVVVITDGYDAGSARNLSEIISLANRHRIRIFVHNIRRNSTYNDLNFIADMTGGRCYPAERVDASESIFNEITAIYIPYITECLITYKSPHCLDGSLRHINVLARSFCSGVDTTIMRSGTFKTFYESTALTPLNISLPSIRVEEDSLVILPLMIDPPITGDSLSAARFVLHYDTTLLSFEGVRTDSATILQDTLVQFARTQNGVEFQTGAKYCPTPSARMMNLVFRVKGVADVALTELTFVSWKFIHGCYAPRPQTATMTIFPKGTLSSDVPPLPITVRLHQNHPNPFTASTVISYELKSPMTTRLAVYDALGRIVRVLANGHCEAGLHRVVFDPDGLPGGVYMYRLEAGKEILNRWMVHTK